MNEQKIAALKEIASRFVKAVANAESKAVELGIINNSGIGPELDELADLTSKLFNTLESKETADDSAVNNEIKHFWSEQSNFIQKHSIHV